MVAALCFYFIIYLLNKDILTREERERFVTRPLQPRQESRREIAEEPECHLEI